MRLRIEDAEDRIERALALHVRVTLPEHHKSHRDAAPDICRNCWDISRGSYAVWPCPTVQALDPQASSIPNPELLITPGGNPSCPVCGRWYGPGEEHACVAEKPARIGDRVRLWIGPPVMGRYEYGFVTAIDTHTAPGVEIRFDQPVNGLDDCYATHEEIEIVSRPATPISPASPQ